MSEYYRVKKFSQLTSTTIKTLRHYDEIGLLKPAKKTISGYKLYSDNDILHLQQILILKFLGYPLTEIKNILSSKTDDITHSLKTQAKLLTKKSATAKDAAWLIDQIVAQKEQNHTLNWKMIFKIMELLQLDKNNSAVWQKQYYTESEYNELAQISLKYTAEFWENYMARWTLLHAEVKSQLHTDSEGEIGLMLGKKWLDLKNEVQADPALQKKGWEAFQKGIVPQETFAYDPKVIEYIAKATKKYKELQQVENSISKDEVLKTL